MKGIGYEDMNRSGTTPMKLPDVAKVIRSKNARPVAGKRITEATLWIASVPGGHAAAE